MTEQEKRKLIEDYENTFIDFTEERFASAYTRHLGRVWAKIIEHVEDGGRVTKKQIQEFMGDAPIREMEYMENILVSVMVAQAAEFVDTDKATGDQRKNLNPFIPLAGALAIKNPVQSVRKMQRLSQAVVRNNPDALSADLKEVFGKANRYFRHHEDVIRPVAKSQFQEMKKNHQDFRTNMSARIVEEYEKSPEPVAVEKIKETAEHRRDIEAGVAVGIIAGLAHNSLEQSKVKNATKSGMTQKIWWSQQDQKVRDTHARVHGTAVPLKKKFKVGKGRAEYPGDRRLPIEEWINCRCTLRYK